MFDTHIGPDKRRAFLECVQSVALPSGWGGGVTADTPPPPPTDSFSLEKSQGYPLRIVSDKSIAGDKRIFSNKRYHQGITCQGVQE